MERMDVIHSLLSRVEIKHSAPKVTPENKWDAHL
jgi:hypothetical protein